MANHPITYADDPSLDTFFRGPQANRSRMAGFNVGPRECLPGHFSNDLPYRLFKRDFAIQASKDFPPNVDEYGRVFGNGVRRDFYGLFYAPGYNMWPANYPAYSNTKIREDKGLAQGFVEEWHQHIFDAFVELFYDPKSLEFVKTNLREGASSVVPYFTTNMTEKIIIGSKAQLSYKPCGELLRAGKYKEAWDKYQIGGFFHSVYRSQMTDGVTKLETKGYKPKDRIVGDIEFAASEGAEGSRFPANRILTTEMLGDNVLSTDFLARLRIAFGGPLGLNSILMAGYKPVRENIYRVGASTFHMTTRQRLEDEVREWEFCIPIDVSDHDINYPTFMGERRLMLLEKMGWDPDFIAVSKLSMSMPVFVTGYHPEKPNALVGDPFNPSWHGGLQSGRADTDVAGTEEMSTIYLIILITYIMPELIPTIRSVSDAKNLIIPVVNGRHPLDMKAKVDDAFLGVREPHLVPRMRKLHQMMVDGEKVSDYMDISYEHGGAYLGNILLYPDSKNIKEARFIGNILSYVANQFVPEYSVQSHIKDRTKVKRSYPGLSLLSYDSIYGTCPIYHDINDMIEFFWRKHFQESYWGFRQKMLDHDLRLVYEQTKKGRDFYSSLSPIEVEVMADPTKLDWKYKPEQVRPELYSHLFKGIPEQVTEPVFRQIIGG